jgi:hypothetical protein
MRKSPKKAMAREIIKTHLDFNTQILMERDHVCAERNCMIPASKRKPVCRTVAKDFEIKINQPGIERLINLGLGFKVYAAVVCEMKFFNCVVGYQIKTGCRQVFAVEFLVYFWIKF